MTVDVQPLVKISIHAPREGGDFDLYANGATVAISIHAPREGGDVPHGINAALHRNFNPRPPRGGRRPVFCC